MFLLRKNFLRLFFLDESRLNHLVEVFLDCFENV
nr:MAG TPA: hypothetical protein [Caudoviricetes sp.]